MIKKKVTEFGFIDLRLNGNDFSKGDLVTGQVYIGLNKPFPGIDVILKIIGRERFSMMMFSKKKSTEDYQDISKKTQSEFIYSEEQLIYKCEEQNFPKGEKMIKFKM